MTKKDFELIAGVIAARVASVNAAGTDYRQSARLGELRDTALLFTIALSATNTGFDRDRFIEAALRPPRKGIAATLPAKLANVESPTS